MVELFQEMRRFFTGIVKMKRNIKFTDPEFQRLLQYGVHRLCTSFEMAGFEIRFVGGCVRDLLMKRSPKDIDLSTTATPEQMMSLFKKNKIRFFETGLSHGTLTVHMNGKDYEITTLRIDKETFGRKANVEFTNDWQLDAARRDLTINAMSLDKEGNLYDYFTGEQDLFEGKVNIVFLFLIFLFFYFLSLSLFA